MFTIRIEFLKTFSSNISVLTWRMRVSPLKRFVLRVILFLQK